MFRSRLPKHVMNELSQLAVLHGCPSSELAVLDRHTTRVRVPAGATLCREGQRGAEAFLILSGEASVRVGGVPVAQIGAGTFCGEMALIDRGARSATVTAATPMEVLAMSVSDFTSLLHAAPVVTRRILALVGNRRRELENAQPR